MAATCAHFTLSTAAPQSVRAGQPANLKGFSAIATGATVNYLKLYWTAGIEPPVVGTTAPNFTVPFGSAVAGNGLTESYPDGMTGQGQLWVAVTSGTGLDTDTGAPAAPSVITLLLE
jgi:hypothetical protein